MPNKIDFRKIPPIGALKGFEAAARLQSVRGAATELNLTHPAITHQIRTLEETLGVKLFARDGRNIVLTPEGKLYYPYVLAAFEKLKEGGEALKRLKPSQALRIQAHVTNSIRWLAPRLTKFRAVHPDIDLHLMTYGLSWDFDESNADIGLVYRDTPVPNHLHWVKLFESTLFPVCSPTLIKGEKRKLRPGDLLEFPLITVYTEGWNWSDWFKVAQPDALKIPTPVIVDTLAVALEMAINGEGIALVNGPAADEDLKSARLICPVDDVVDGPGEWGVICLKEILTNQRVKAFIDWISAEAMKR